MYSASANTSRLNRCSGSVIATHCRFVQHIASQFISLHQDIFGGLIGNIATSPPEIHIAIATNTHLHIASMTTTLSPTTGAVTPRGIQHTGVTKERHSVQPKDYHMSRTTPQFFRIVVSIQLWATELASPPFGHSGSTSKTSKLKQKQNEVIFFLAMDRRKTLQHWRESGIFVLWYIPSDRSLWFLDYINNIWFYLLVFYCIEWTVGSTDLGAIFV